MIEKKRCHRDGRESQEKGPGPSPPSLSKCESSPQSSTCRPPSLSPVLHGLQSCHLPRVTILVATLHHSSLFPLPLLGFLLRIP